MPEADFVVSPENAEETSKVVKIANYYKIPVTTWGGGGGTQGGAIPVCGGILLDTKRMNKIYGVNAKSMYIECGAGAIYKHVEWAANEKGFTTMHYPSSLTCSTVGGFLAHRGIGVVSTKYGKIDDMVLSMEIVLPNESPILVTGGKHIFRRDSERLYCEPYTPESTVLEVFENPKAVQAFNAVFGGIFTGSEIAWMKGEPKTLQFMAEFRDMEGKMKLSDFPAMLAEANRLFLRRSDV